MKWMTSDFHFWHTNVIKFCNRPFDTVETMNEVLIENYNKLVKPEDTVYLLGDLSFAGSEKTHSVLSRLNGYKIVLMGNHDHRNRLQKRWSRFGIAELHTYLQMKIGDHDVNISHYPYKGLAQDARTFEDQLEFQDKILIHGHVHEKWKVKGNMINVGVDVWDFKPVSEEQLIGEIKGILNESQTQ